MGWIQEVIKNESDKNKLDRQRSLSKPLSKRYVNFKVLFAFLERSRLWERFKNCHPKAQTAIVGVVFVGIGSGLYHYFQKLRPVSQTKFYEREVQEMIKLRQERGWEKES